VEPWRRNVVAVTTASFVGFTGFTLVMPFLASFFQELGVRGRADLALWAGLTLGVTPAVTALCAPFWGRVGDRFGSKILVQRSLLSFVVVTGLMSQATAPWQLFALRAVQGLVAGYGGLTISMAALSAPPERMAAAIGTVQTAQRIGPAVGPVLGGILAPLVGYRATFIGAAVMYALAFVLLTVLYRDPPRAPVPPEADGLPFWNVLTVQNFLLLMGVIFALQLVDRSFGPVLLLYLDELHYTAGQAPVVAGVLFAALAVAGAAGNQIAAAALARTSLRVVMAGGAATAGVALGVFAFGERLAVLVPAMAVFGLGLGTATTAAFTAGGALVPRHRHATSFGFLTSASLVGSAVSPALAGLVAGQSIRVVFASGVVVLGVLSVVVSRLMVSGGELEPAPPTDET
jgi:MFS family permease